MILKNFYQKKIMFFICLLLGLFLYSNSALAQATYNALVTIPGIRSGAGVQVYLSGLYTFLISVVGVVAMGAIVIGGARYLTSAGNPSVIEDAKHTIYSAIIGLLLAITSWVIIWEINPDVTVLKNPAMPWEAVGYSPTGPTPQCALATGSPTSGCACVDNPAVPVLGITDPMPPYVASVSSSCAAGVSSASPYAITIIFSELMDPASVATFTAYTFNPAVILASYDVDNTGNASIVNINFAAGGLAANTDYTVTIKKTATRLSGVGTMLADYVFKFTTNATFAAACVPPITGTGCNRVCSDKSLASDGLYHCIKADLRVGNSYNPIGKTVTVKSGEAVYFDGRTYSANPTSPGFNINVPSDDLTFDNGMNVYEICYDSNAITCTIATASYGCADDLFNPCAIAWVITGKKDGWMPCGVTKTSYTVTETTTFKAKLRAISKSDCLTRYENEVTITVNPK